MPLRPSLLPLALLYKAPATSRPISSPACLASPLSQEGRRVTLPMEKLCCPYCMTASLSPVTTGNMLLWSSVYLSPLPGLWVHPSISSSWHLTWEDKWLKQNWIWGEQGCSQRQLSVFGRAGGLKATSPSPWQRQRDNLTSAKSQCCFSFPADSSHTLQPQPAHFPHAIYVLGYGVRANYH